VVLRGPLDQVFAFTTIASHPFFFYAGKSICLLHTFICINAINSSKMHFTEVQVIL